MHDFSPTGCTIPKLPPEILDHIASQITKPRDLLSFALASLILHDIVIPRHIRYRHVTCDLEYPEPFYDLVRHQDRVCNVRQLTFWQNFRPARREDIASFINAVKCMPQLSSAHLDDMGAYHQDQLGQLWYQLKQHGSLRHLSLIFTRNDEIYDGLEFLTYLKTFRVSYVGRGFTSFRKIGDFVNQNHGLEELAFCCTSLTSSRQVGEMLEKLRLPRLRTFLLDTNVNMLPLPGDAISTFLRLHDTLESIALKRAQLPATLLPCGALPLLSELTGRKEALLDILSSPTPRPRPLRKIDGVCCGSRFWAALPLIDLTTLRKLENVTFESLQDIDRLPHEIPNLDWLSVSVRVDEPVWNTAMNRAEWMHVLSRFPTIRAFHGLSLFDDAVGVEERISVIAEALPHLEELDHWDGEFWKVILLNREGGSLTWSVGNKHDISR